MGKPGTKPTPTRLKILKGAQPCRINKNEPKVIAGCPEAPTDLDDFGRRAWDWITGELAGMQLLATADRDAMYLFCEAYSHYRHAKDELKTHGLIIESGGESRVDGRKGFEDVVIAIGSTRKKNPAWDVARDSMTMMLKILAEFGMTPSARSRIKAPGDGPKDEFEEFLSRKKKAR